MSIYQLDPSHSAAQFKVRHMMIANVKGEFDKLSGTVNFDPANPSAATVEATIDVSSISTGDEQRDQDLKSPNFLDVEKHPTITFKSKKVTAAEGGGFNVVGDLTMHGITKEMTLHVEELTEERKDPWGNMRRGATAKARINRRDFDISFNVALEAGGFLVGEELDLTFDVEMIAQAA
jgi:polyisoprenoid-binding protein YceI